VLILVFFHSQGDADLPRPRARQGAQIGSTRDDKAAFVEGATGGSERGGDGRAVARHGCGLGAAARGGGGGDGRGGVDIASACPYCR
jgi:hypothetical protein